MSDVFVGLLLIIKKCVVQNTKFESKFQFGKSCHRTARKKILSLTGFKPESQPIKRGILSDFKSSSLVVRWKDTQLFS
jgi:hypothetical protein